MSTITQLTDKIDQRNQELLPGAVLTREWTVTTMVDGGFAFEGKNLRRGGISDLSFSRIVLRYFSGRSSAEMFWSENSKGAFDTTVTLTEWLDQMPLVVNIFPRIELACLGRAVKSASLHGLKDFAVFTWKNSALVGKSLEDRNTVSS